jgi:L-amino acid N-acyltransferase YncA
MIAIRPAAPEDAAGIGRVHVDSWRTTYAGIVSDTTLANLSYEKSTDRNRAFMAQDEPGRHYFVAEDETGRIVGFAMGGRARGENPGFEGELYGIYLLKESQGQGTGRRLVGAMASALAGDGVRSMMVWVLAENPSRRFYEALGGRYIKEQEITIGGQPLIEVAYGWNEIAALCR